MKRSMFVTRYCLYCGPRKVTSQYYDEETRTPDAIPCPTCGLDPAEARMIEDVRAHGFEECYRAELQKGRSDNAR